jgi:hypothetical protein
MFELAATKMLERLLDEDADLIGKTNNVWTLVKSAATALDKSRLVHGMPTQIMGVITVVEQIYNTANVHGIDPVIIFENVLEELNAIPATATSPDDS